jgi:hypothetical protein
MIPLPHTLKYGPYTLHLWVCFALGWEAFPEESGIVAYEKKGEKEESKKREEIRRGERRRRRKKERKERVTTYRSLSWR